MVLSMCLYISQKNETNQKSISFWSCALIRIRYAFNLLPSQMFYWKMEKNRIGLKLFENGGYLFSQVIVIVHTFSLQKTQTQKISQSVSSFSLFFSDFNYH